MMTELYITEKLTVFYSTQSSPCKKYNEEEDRKSVLQDSQYFMDCSRKGIWKLLKSKINCSLVGLEPFFDYPNEMRECQNLTEAAQVS